MLRRPPRRRVIGPRFDGARALDVFLRERQRTVPDFCESERLDRFHIDRLLRGQVKRPPPVDIVLDLERATEGRVTPAMWREETLRLDVDGDVPSEPESSPSVDDDVSDPSSSDAA